MAKQRTILFFIWLILSAACYFFLFAVVNAAEVVAPKDAGRVWKWFAIISGPMLAGMITTFIAQEKTGLKDMPPTRPLIFRLAVGFCIVYWILTYIVILVWNPEKTSFAAWLEAQQGYIWTFEGILLALLGYYFSGIKSPKPEDPTPPVS